MQSMQNCSKPNPAINRTIQIKFRVTDEERSLIYEKMRQIGTTNLAAYLRKMVIDGRIIEVDYSNLKEACYQMQKIGTNINQIARRANTSNSVYKGDMDEIKKAVDTIWQLLRSSLSRHG